MELIDTFIGAIVALALAVAAYFKLKKPAETETTQTTQETQTTTETAQTTQETQTTTIAGGRAVVTRAWIGDASNAVEDGLNNLAFGQKIFYALRGLKTGPVLIGAYLDDKQLAIHGVDISPTRIDVETVQDYVVCPNADPGDHTLTFKVASNSGRDGTDPQWKDIVHFPVKVRRYGD